MAKPPGNRSKAWESVSAGDQHLGMPAYDVEQAQRGSGRLPAPTLPARGGYRRDIHHRGKNRLADVELLADRSHLRGRQWFDARRQWPGHRAQGKLLLARQVKGKRLDTVDEIAGVELNVLVFHFQIPV